MKSKDFFNSKGFSPAWLEEVTTQKQELPQNIVQRKELSVLLAELEEIKNEFEKISIKKEKLKNLLSFYNGFIYN